MTTTALPSFRLRMPPRPGATITGMLLVVPGFMLLWAPSLWAAALGLELIATAFWWWARAASDPSREIPRWAWLRRPAAALWLAAALHAAVPGLSHQSTWFRQSLELWRHVDAVAVVWAGLELLAALPLARPFSDLPGPLLPIRPWLPVLLPASGFAVLWRQAPHWTGVAEVRVAVEVLLVLTSVLATLRAFGRRRWTASLRWLVVSDCAMAVLLITIGAVLPGVVLMLWLAACGGHAFLLAGELRGAAPRRGVVLSLLWRISTFVTSAALTWPALVTLFPTSAERLRAFDFPATALAALLTAWINVGRIVEAPERRSVQRADPALTFSHLGALLGLVTAPVALLGALVTGFHPSLGVAIVALLPAALGGSLALWSRGRAASEIAQERAQAMAATGTDGSPVHPVAAPAYAHGHAPGADAGAQPAHAGTALRQFARVTFNVVVAVERAVVFLFVRLVQALTSPLRDLNSGDAQEYLLFLVGLSVLVLVLPLLR
ncbi:MAG TPA: hypothetical protein VI792_09535 [Candidatus Eisenbacteria bacterium]